MAALVRSSEVEAVIRRVLTEEGYVASKERLHGETGADIVAVKGNEKFYIEAISFKSSRPARAKDFYEVAFRAMSRIADNASLCVIALPARFGKGLPKRAKAIGPAWLRIGTAFPELRIWLVDTSNPSIKYSAWNDWAN
jgi:hypothetical protein